MKIKVRPYGKNSNDEPEVDIKYHKDDFWSLDYTLALVLKPILEEFSKEYTCSEKDKMTRKDIEAAIDAFSLIIKEEKGYALSNTDNKNVDRGLRAFASCFRSLWF